jgi:hypothetical protein
MFEYGRRAGVCFLTFCRGKVAGEKPEMKWPQNGTFAAACLIGRLWRNKKSTKKAVSFFVFYAFLCGDGFFSSLLLASVKDERKSQGGLTQVVDFHDFSRYFSLLC